MLLLTDSECTIASKRREGISFRPYFQHRLAEIEENLEEMKQHTQSVEAHHIPGRDNIADLLTRGQASIQDMERFSPWLTGPKFLLTEVSTWPLDLTTLTSVPTDEVKAQSMAVSDNPDSLGLILQAILTNVSSLDKATGTTARVMRAMGTTGKSQGQILTDPNPTDRAAAYRLLLLHESSLSRQAFEEGKLLSIGAFCKKGIVLCQGRIGGNKLTQLLGKSHLPVLMPKSTLARLILRMSHKEDHRRGSADVVARSRREAWIVKARNIAQSEVKDCMECRRLSTDTAQQLMSDIPEQYLKAAAPFTVVSLDLFGPMTVRGMGGASRKTQKVWGVVYSCLATKAIAIWTCPGYDAHSFLDTHTWHTAVYGDPLFAVSDHGSQIVAASRDLADWGIVVSATSKAGTQWRFTEKGCAWRNGIAERAIGMIKSSILHLPTEVGNMNIMQLETALLRLSMIINRRPIAVRNFAEDDFHAITPADLLLGRATGRLRQKFHEGFLDKETEAADLVPNTQGKVELLVEAWWQQWISRAFSLLLPRRKWMTSHRNMQAHDIVMLRYDSKYGQDRYRLARVVETYPDVHGTVRSVKIAVRDRRGLSREPPEACRTLRDHMQVGIQRLVVLLPAEEQGFPAPQTVATSQN